MILNGSPGQVVTYWPLNLFLLDSKERRQMFSWFYFYFFRWTWEEWMSLKNFGCWTLMLLTWNSKFYQHFCEASFSSRLTITKSADLRSGLNLIRIWRPPLQALYTFYCKMYWVWRREIVTIILLSSIHRTSSVKRKQGFFWMEEMQSIWDILTAAGSLSARR